MEKEKSYTFGSSEVSTALPFLLLPVIFLLRKLKKLIWVKKRVKVTIFMFNIDVKNQKKDTLLGIKQ